MLKNLSQFQRFDFQSFVKDKVLVVTGMKPWANNDTGEIIGTKISLGIAKDGTKYNVKEGQVVSNRFQTFDVKIAQIGYRVPLDSVVRISGVKSATIWGDYRENLSVEITGLEVIKNED